MSDQVGVDIIGHPLKEAVRRVLILVANTQTEKDLLRKHAETIKKTAVGTIDIAWVNEVKTRDRLNHKGLIESLDADSDTELVPIGLVWKPEKEGRLSRSETVKWMKLLESNSAQKSVLKKDRDRCKILVGESAPQSVVYARYRKAVGKEPETQEIADYIARQAALTIERDSRPETGSSLKYPKYVKRSILARSAFQDLLSEYAAETGTPIAKVQSLAKDAIDELIPTVRPLHIATAERLFRFVCRLGYEDKMVYDQAQMDAIRTLALDRPVALVWTHKTHVDGPAILVSTQEESFPLVHTIGGDNMAFFGIGYLMKRAGAIFIRRNMKDSPVYKIVLRYYLGYLLEKRFPVSWALEGTRSRNGKLMPPRFGILKYVVESAIELDLPTLTVVPVSIYYDLIAELGDYAAEQTGQTKRKESITWFFDYLRSLRKPMGRISLGLGEPLEINTRSDELISALHEDSETFSITLQKIAFAASVRANEVTPIMPSSLAALALTGAAPQALTEEELRQSITQLREWAIERGLPMTEELETYNADRVRSIVTSMIDIGVVSRYDKGPERVYSINDGKHFEASYYRNNAIHFFTDKAMIELALARVVEENPSDALALFWAEVLRLRDTFKFEFFYPETDEYKSAIDAEFKRYDENWEKTLASGGAENLLRLQGPLIAHAVLRPFTEAYLVVADVLLSINKTDPSDESTVVAAALKLGKQAFLQRRITSEESIGKLMFSNGYKLASNRGLIADDGADTSAQKRAFARDMKVISNRLSRIGQVASDIRDTPEKTQLKIVTSN